MPVITLPPKCVARRGKRRVAVDVPWRTILSLLQRIAAAPVTRRRIPATTRRYIKEFIASHREDIEYLARH